MQPETLTRQRRVHPAQAAFLGSNALYRGFVGGRGSGKSWVCSYDLLQRARRGRLYMMVSPTYTILADTDFRMFCALARECCLLQDRKISPPAVRLSSGAEILFRSADDPEKLRGPNLSGAVLNEASLMHRDAYDIVIACLREGGERGWLSAGFTPKGLQHWTYQVFGTAQPDTAIFHAATRENPFIDAEFAATLARHYPEALARQELAGEFMDIEGEAFQVIPTAWARAAMQRWTANPPGQLDALGVDVARGGADRTVIAPRHGAWIGRPLVCPGSSTPDGAAVVSLIAVALHSNPLALVCVDVIGVGAAVYDGCAVLRDCRALPCNFAAGTDARDLTGQFGFANLRAFALWSLREALDPDGATRLALPPDEGLLAELTAARWKMTLRGVQVEPKEDIMERLGRSPDLADAMALACLLPPALG